MWHKTFCSSPEPKVQGELLWSFTLRVIDLSVRPQFLKMPSPPKPLSETILTKFHRENPWVILKDWKMFKDLEYMQDCGCHGNQKKKLYNSSCQKSLDHFQYNLEEMFLWWPSIKIFKPFWLVKKHGGQGEMWGVGGLIFPIISM